jgi:hypothetical protein
VDPETQEPKSHEEVPEEPLDSEANTQSLLSNYEEESEDVKNCIRILVAAFHVGFNSDKIAKYTQLSRDFVRPRVKRLRENGVFEGRNVLNVEWLDQSDNQWMQLLLDAMVANGDITRKTVPTDDPGKVIFNYYPPKEPVKPEPIWYVPPPDPKPQVEPRKRGIWGKNG